MSSPPGRSILMTSAPASASSRVASGPGNSVVKSRTRTPDNGCMNAPSAQPSLRQSPALHNLARRLLSFKRASLRFESQDMKLPRSFFQPLTIGAPQPLRELPVKLERMIHFVPPHNEKVTAKVPELIRQVDVVLGNLEDAIPADAKEAARNGFIAMAQSCDFGETGLWTRCLLYTSPSPRDRQK